MKDINISINDNFWSTYTKLIRDEVIPYQWDALNDNIADAEPSAAIRNFRIAAGEEEGEFYGMVFQDSDVAKWLEAVAYSLETYPDPELEARADQVIDLIGRAQQPDGYLNTYFIVKEPDKRWTNLEECHELYCAGHMIEAAVAYYEVTGKRKFMDIMARFADHIDSVFGPEEGKKKGYPGHQEIELALVRLYKATGNRKYLKLAKYFLDERGKQPYYFDIEFEKRGRKEFWPGHRNMGRHYDQAHLPVREQKEAVGHAVRALYMYSGMADVAMETGDEELLEVCRRLWNNIVYKRMYITGAVGSQVFGESFTFDYDLPNDTVYGETCAAIALVFFAKRMLKAEPKGSYADVMERALYNGVISGMSLDGKSFFYVNPLEVNPEACEKNAGFKHVKPVRQKWFACACCPPNIARLLASIGHYIYDIKDNTVYTHLYVASRAEMNVEGEKIGITQTTDYPWDGNVGISVNLDGSKEFNLALRIPGGCRDARISVNGQEIDIAEVMADGYAIIKRRWENGDKVEMNFAMEPVRVRSNPLVRANAGKVAIQSGPIIYCLEEVDNGPGLQTMVLPKDSPLEMSFCKDALGGVNIITAQGKKARLEAWDGDLYKADACIEYEPVKLTFIPYYAWVNREPGEMTVWVHEC
jgi:DUF1680 family protein